MRSLLGLVSVVVFALASCGMGATAPDDPPVETAGNGVAASCHATCNTAADCGTPGDPLYDPNHFTCQAGLCQWQGCRSASECNAEGHGSHFVCRAAAAGPPSCAPACQKPSDCVPPGAPTPSLQDASHYTCAAGACVWTGCRSTSECVAATHDSQVSCEAAAGEPVRACVPTCKVATDCVVPGSGKLGDAHHYACQSGRCQWLGCKSTLECTTALSSSKYVCE
jgi:hypothetical protein